MARTENVHPPMDAVSRACDNPECTNRVAWTSQPGRPQTFCSPGCRKRARYAADRLRLRIQRLEQDRSAIDLTYRQQREVDAELARQRWLMTSYPPALQA